MIQHKKKRWEQLRNLFLNNYDSEFQYNSEEEYRANVKETIVKYKLLNKTFLRQQQQQKDKKKDKEKT